MTGRRDPLKVTPDDIRGFFEQNGRKQKTYQVLTGHLLGMSPLLAKEVIFRANGDIQQKSDDADYNALHASLQAVIEPLGARDWQPGAVVHDGVTQAYSVYPLTHLAGWEQVESISEAMAAFYGAPVGQEAYEAAKKPARAAIEEGRAKMRAKLASLERSLKDDSEMEQLRQSGELILAYQYTLEDGQTELKAQYDPDGPELTIRLDASITPLENAQRYFNRYNKAKRALEDVPGLIEDAKTELAYLDQLENDLAQARNWPDIDEVQQALIASGYWRGKQAKRIGGGGQSAPIRVVTKNGFVIWVGRNSRQNEIVTFKKSGKDDLWLHARQVPGAHVIIKNDGRSIPDEVIEQAASMAAYYSSMRNEGRVPVDVTRIKYVKKIKGAGQGMVTYRNEETRTAIPKSEKAFENP
jgi:predicted ribosome quality control (RQC) complex YloA/Tae2 family protein